MTDLLWIFFLHICIFSYFFECYKNVVISHNTCYFTLPYPYFTFKLFYYGSTNFVYNIRHNLVCKCKAPMACCSYLNILGNFMLLSTRDLYGTSLSHRILVPAPPRNSVTFPISDQIVAIKVRCCVCLRLQWLKNSWNSTN